MRRSGRPCRRVPAVLTSVPARLPLRSARPMLTTHIVLHAIREWRVGAGGLEVLFGPFPVLTTRFIIRKWRGCRAISRGGPVTYRPFPAGAPLGAWRPVLTAHRVLHAMRHVVRRALHAVGGWRGGRRRPVLTTRSAMAGAIGESLPVRSSAFRGGPVPSGGGPVRRTRTREAPGRMAPRAVLSPMRLCLPRGVPGVVGARAVAVDPGVLGSAPGFLLEGRILRRVSCAPASSTTGFLLETRATAITGFVLDERIPRRKRGAVRIVEAHEPRFRGGFVQSRGGPVPRQSRGGPVLSRGGPRTGPVQSGGGPERRGEWRGCRERLARLITERNGRLVAERTGRRIHEPRRASRWSHRRRSDERLIT
mmetsp:Transcript_69669/g.159792  ORF Transcript_69669/g.159792 Transcript_69669/m.159792 type:complete len:365 (+) Transcript_69669:92-1186(+)